MSERRWGGRFDESRKGKSRRGWLGVEVEEEDRALCCVSSRSINSADSVTRYHGVRGTTMSSHLTPRTSQLMSFGSHAYFYLFVSCRWEAVRCGVGLSCRREGRDRR